MIRGFLNVPMVVCTGNPSFNGIANLLAAGGGITYAIYLFTVVRTGG
ncbi:MAG: hypothetical protein MUF38_10890 [Anaerolineae bacterium]|nr:hypothetical protein [Anaerolineae bacterium]